MDNSVGVDRSVHPDAALGCAVHVWIEAESSFGTPGWTLRSTPTALPGQRCPWQVGTNDGWRVAPWVAAGGRAQRPAPTKSGCAVGCGGGRTQRSAPTNDERAPTSPAWRSRTARGELAPPRFRFRPSVARGLQLRWVSRPSAGAGFECARSTAGGRREPGPRCRKEHFAGRGLGELRQPVLVDDVEIVAAVLEMQEEQRGPGADQLLKRALDPLLDQTVAKSPA